MKNLVLLIIFAACLSVFSCKKDDVSQRFKFLTRNVWISDSLLVNGVDASDDILKDFKGEAKFNEDGTGYFGKYVGTWKFAYDETQLQIKSDSLTKLPGNTIATEIIELTNVSLKLKTGFPGNPPLSIRMTFKAK